MMSEDVTENGRINDQGEEEISPVPDINSPRQSVTTPPGLASPEEPEMEFFKQKGGENGVESGSEGGGGSPQLHDKEDNVSHHSRSYVTVSPSVSPGEWGRSLLVGEGVSGGRSLLVGEGGKQWPFC